MEPKKEEAAVDEILKVAGTGELLRVGALAHPIHVDREKEIIYGVVMAQEGDFKSEGRGTFDELSLSLIREFVGQAPNGTKSRLAHPDESHDGVDKTLGRFRDPRMDMVGARDSEGVLKTNPARCVRADLHLNPAAHKGPFDMADYLMTYAETDPDIISTSLVIKTDKEYRIDKNGLPLRGPDGEELPPLWRPTAVMACDVVSTGDAVDGLLSKMGGTIENLAKLPNGAVFLGADLLDKHFAGKPREFVEEHCLAYLQRYLDRRYGLSDPARSGGDTPDHSPTEVPGAEHPENPAADAADAEPLHDGCRSKMGIHFTEMCRGCKKEMRACLCKDRLKENHLCLMSLCPDCQKLQDGGKDTSQETPDDHANAREGDAAGSEEYQAARQAREQAVRELEVFSMVT
jgi:hypothetical protein